MIDRLLKKTKSTLGESLSETLLAVLIGSIALIMLASMVTAAKNSVDQSREKLNSYYNANNSLEKRNGTGDTTTVSISGKSSTTDPLNISYSSVSYYSQQTFPSQAIIAYGK